MTSHLYVIGAHCVIIAPAFQRSHCLLHDCLLWRRAPDLIDVGWWSATLYRYIRTRVRKSRVPLKCHPRTTDRTYTIRSEESMDASHLYAKGVHCAIIAPAFQRIHCVLRVYCGGGHLI